MVDTRNPSTQEQIPIPQDWFERAEEAARRYNLPVPEDRVSPEEVERNLKQFEQDDGQ